MKKLILALSVLGVLVVPTAGNAGFNTPAGCLAVNAGERQVGDQSINGSTQRSCTVVAGLEAEAQAVADVVVVGGRVSWGGIGKYKVEMFETCRDTTPVRVWNSPGIAESNNGGGYFGFCIKATALNAGSAVAIGPMYFPLAP